MGEKRLHNLLSGPPLCLWLLFTSAPLQRSFAHGVTCWLAAVVIMIRMAVPSFTIRALFLLFHLSKTTIRAVFLLEVLTIDTVFVVIPVVVVLVVTVVDPDALFFARVAAIPRFAPLLHL
jgi:hypothetical protein